MALTDDIYKKMIPVATSKVVGPVVNGQRAHSLQKRAGQGREEKGKNEQSMGSACEPHEGGESQRGTPPRALIPPLHALIFKATGHVKVPFPQALFTYHNPLIQIIIIFFIPSRQIIQTKFI